MATIGRPPTGDVKPGWMLFRILQVLSVYQQQRLDGIKYQSAITEAINVIRTQIPGMPISISSVKRILAETHSKEHDFSWIVKSFKDPVTEKLSLGLSLEPFKIYPTQHQILYQKQLR